jgi:hypothetical protein
VHLFFSEHQQAERAAERYSTTMSVTYGEAANKKKQKQTNKRRELTRKKQRTRKYEMDKRLGSFWLARVVRVGSWLAVLSGPPVDFFIAAFKE